MCVKTGRSESDRLSWTYNSLVTVAGRNARSRDSQISHSNEIGADTWPHYIHQRAFIARCVVRSVNDQWIHLNVPIFKFKKHAHTYTYTRTRVGLRMTCATLPCNHVYVLNGKIDECRHSSARGISRVQGRGRRVRRFARVSCLVQSLREIDKEPTTVGAQLGHRLRMLAYESSR